MDQRERNTDFEEVIRTALQGYAASRVWTALPGIVVSYSAATCTATVQPAIQIQNRNSVGVFNYVKINPIEHVPVVFPAGAGMFLSFALQPGDEVLLVVCCRCIDAWQQLGGVQVQAEFRLHDLSDAIAVPGLFSSPRVPAGVVSTGISMGKQDGTAYVEVTPTGAVNIVAPGGLTINGNVLVTEEVTAQTSSASPIPLSTHVHGGISTPLVPATAGPLP